MTYRKIGTRDPSGTLKKPGISCNNISFKIIFIIIIIIFNLFKVDKKN